MKKALILISFILAALASFSFKGMVGKLPTSTVDTFVNKQTISSNTTLYIARGGFRPDSALILPFQFFADTTAANFSKAAGYNGSLVLIGTDVWVRTLNPNKWNKFALSSGGGYVLISDTALMLTPYLRKSDTAFMLSTRVKYSDTAYQMSGYVRKGYPVLYTDSANMLSPYLRKTDTASMLVPYVRNDRTITTNAPLFGGGDLSTNRTFGIDTGRANAQIPSGGDLNKVRDSLVGLISGGGLGTVLSVSTTDGIGIVSSVANPTSTPNISIRVDTVAISTRAWRQKGDDSLGGLIALKVNISDTANMLIPYLLKSDTATMLAPFVQYSDTAYMLSNRLKISDTAYMLSNRLKISDTATMLVNRLKISDTATMLSGYTRVQRFLDTTLVLRTLINTKGTGTVTSVGLTAPSFLTITNSPITTSGNIVATLANQTANTIFSGPTTGSPAQPAFRALVAADLTASTLQTVTTNGNTTTNGITVGELISTNSNSFVYNSANIGTFNFLNTLANTSAGTGHNSFIKFSNGANVLNSFGVVENGGANGDFVFNSFHSGSYIEPFRVSSGGNITGLGTLTVTGLSSGSAGNFVVNGGAGLLVTRTASQVLSDIGAGTVSSIATTNGILGGTITNTGTLQIDSSAYSTKANVVALLLGKLNLSDTSSMLSNYARKYATLTNRRVVFVNSNGELKDTTGFTFTGSGDLNIPTSVNTSHGDFSGTINIGVTSNSGVLNLNNTSATQAAFYGYSDFGVNRPGSGKINLGSNGSFQGTIQYYDGGSTVLYVDNTFDNASAAINFRLRTNGTPVIALALDGAGNGVFSNTAKAVRIIGNSGTDNTVDAVQSGGGSMLSNLYRMEGKIQATSTTIDATATVWNDNTNGSTVTYTLPGTSSLAGGFFGFIKTGTGNLTLSGTIVKKDGTSAGGTLTLASTDGLQWFWFNGSTWYQSN